MKVQLAILKKNLSHIKWNRKKDPENKKKGPVFQNHLGFLTSENLCFQK